jgi:hypothetical protein
MTKQPVSTLAESTWEKLDELYSALLRDGRTEEARLVMAMRKEVGKIGNKG